MNAEADPILTVEDLHLSYRLKGSLLRGSRSLDAVTGVSFNVSSGEAFGLVGESGCGKSSLARAILHLNKPQSGRIVFAGRVLNNLKAAEWRNIRRRMQYVFQDPLAALDPRMPVVDQVAEALAIHRVGDAQSRRRRAFDQLMSLGITRELAGKYPHALSGGQRQRVVIARSLMLEPSLLICDEPLSALDVSVQAQVVNLLVDLRERLRLALLFISHDLSLVRHMCQRVAVMYSGRIVEMGDTETIFDRPRHPYTRMLIAAVPVPDPADEEAPAIIHGEPPSLLDPPPGCRFSPRCPVAVDRCRQEVPELLKLADGRLAACHLEN